MSLTPRTLEWYYSATQPERACPPIWERFELTSRSRTRPHRADANSSAMSSWTRALSCRGFPPTLLESLGIQRRKVWHFRQADGTVLARWTGAAFVYAGGTSATDDVVFGEPNDLVLLGARSLEGLNLRIDPVAKILIDAGPAPAAAGV